jgi:adenylyltransferase/sulfurtransferase
MVRQIGPRELAREMANDHPVYLLDVRQPCEHETAALPGSVLIPLGELAARAGEVKPEPGVLLVVYCHHGVRSLAAASLLQRLGHGNVASLAGGIDAWSQEVDPTVPRYAGG